ncbi:50S ribosomal protein L19 [Spiroplasma sabaudiense Ar-1343]|uniref:Large ribosomal subunit protein bL19 n=1 Tax=Spiroplasma sabaudiense Ar-1343 TaxID=1276257 RepID=W6A9I2_9MOLU|nr:50S ribosomal protein L19 [Spiroplasma sabaudiense]AHI53682.1 50S ribosomal protein L19 [Spiroplasma sabaudiense Ar-1343]
MNALSKVTSEFINGQLRNDLPKFSSGDTIKINVKIKEGEKFRIQAFEGLVIKTQGSGVSFTVVVRKISNGVAVERTFPLHSPIIDSIQVIKRGRVRRARIYYIRKLSGKAARIKEIVTARPVKGASVEKKPK